MSDSSDHIILNGELIPKSQAAIPAETSGLYYGVGAFETFLCEKGRIFKFYEHVERLHSGLEYLEFSKDKTMDAISILGQIQSLLKKNDLFETDTKIRIQVSLAENQGYSGYQDSSFITIITSAEIKKSYTPQHLILSKTSVVPSSARPARFKLSNMLHYRQAYREAEQKGADDSVMLTTGGFVAETSIANIFWLRKDRVFTPAEECDILPGIMRNSILNIIREKLGYEVNEGNYSMDELMNADSVWLTNSAIGVVPVSKIEDISFNNERNFFSDLSEHLSAYKKENMTDV